MLSCVKRLLTCFIFHNVTSISLHCTHTHTHMRNSHSAAPGLFQDVSIVSVRVADAEIRYSTLACAISVCFARLCRGECAFAKRARDCWLAAGCLCQFPKLYWWIEINLDTPLPSDVCKFTAAPYFSSQIKLPKHLIYVSTALSPSQRLRDILPQAAESIKTLHGSGPNSSAGLLHELTRCQRKIQQR